MVRLMKSQGCSSEEELEGVVSGSGPSRAMTISAMEMDTAGRARA
jgi:hypothetical protein